MYTMNWWEVYKECPRAKPGMTAIKGDEWPSHDINPIIEGDNFDNKYFGTMLRYERYDDIIPSLPVKIKLTGVKVYFDGSYTRKMRCKITTWDNNEEPVSFLGWLYLWDNYS